jgi:hypothetical protein
VYLGSLKSTACQIGLGWGAGIVGTFAVWFDLIKLSDFYQKAGGNAREFPSCPDSLPGSSGDGSFPNCDKE